jgi:hypothetical protein
MAVIQGVTSGNTAEVDANNQVLVRPATTLANIGYDALASRSDPGAGGTARVREILASMNKRIGSSIIQTLWDDVFAATSQNTALYKFLATTMTGAQAGGLLVLNNSGLTTINTNVAFQSTRTFPFLINNELRFIMNGGFQTGSVHVANVTTEFGLMSITGLPAATAPFDGVFFRYNSANELRGVMTSNSVETQTAALTKPTDNVFHEWMILLTNTAVEFWIDNEFRAAITLTTDAPLLTQPFLSAHPITLRIVNGGSAPATAVKLFVGGLQVQQAGFGLDRPWQQAMAGMGRMLSQGQNGGTMGSTALYVNNANPGTAVPTNTTAALGNGLGGIFQETLTLAAGTDGIISSFQNPAGSVSQPGRNLIIDGVTISGVVTVALTTNPLSGTMALCYGHTAVSLATAESGSFVSGGAKAPRRIALCTTSVASATAAAGTPVVGPNANVFNTPIVVAPGEFIQISHKKISVAPATGSIMWTITFSGHFE